MSTAELLFKNIFTSLIQNLSIAYPEYPQFKLYYNLIRFQGSKFWSDTFKEFRTYTLPFVKQIEDRDEQFFMNAATLDSIEPDESIANEIQQIKELYFLPKTTQKVKNEIWDYINKLVKLSHSE